MTATAYTREELVDFLNRMLEAERAGARALLEFLGEYDRRSEGWKILRKVQGDEAHNCARIGRQLAHLGAAYSHATGEFLDKAIAVRGRRARLEILVKGLRWAVRKFEEASPRIADPAVRDLLASMSDSHRHSIAACETLAKTLTD